MRAAIQVGQLLEVAWVSLVAGVSVSVVFSLVVLFSARSAEARRRGNGGVATTYAGLAALSLTVFLAGVGFGVQVMLSKG